MPAQGASRPGFSMMTIVQGMVGLVSPGGALFRGLGWGGVRMGACVSLCFVLLCCRGSLAREGETNLLK